VSCGKQRRTKNRKGGGAKKTPREQKDRINKPLPLSKRRGKPIEKKKKGPGTNSERLAQEAEGINDFRITRGEKGEPLLMGGDLKTMDKELSQGRTPNRYKKR